MHQFMTEVFVLSTKIPWISYLLSILINHTGKQTYSNIGKLWIPLNLQNFYLSDFWFHLKNWTHFTNIFPISTTGLCQILGLVVPFLHQAFSRFPNHILNVLQPWFDVDTSSVEIKNSLAMTQVWWSDSVFIRNQRYIYFSIVEITSYLVKCSGFCIQNNI